MYSNYPNRKQKPDKYAPRTSDPFLNLFTPGRQRSIVVKQFTDAIAAHKSPSPSKVVTFVYHFAQEQAQEAAGKDEQLHRTLCSLVTRIQRHPAVSRCCARFLMDGGEA